MISRETADGGVVPGLNLHPPSQALSRQLSPRCRVGRAKWAFAHLLLFLYRSQYFCMMIICALASPRVGERCHEVTERGRFCQKRRKREKRRGRHSPPCTTLLPCPAVGEGLAPPGRAGFAHCFCWKRSCCAGRRGRRPLQRGGPPIPRNYRRMCFQPQ